MSVITVFGWLCVLVLVPATLLAIYQWIFAAFSLLSQPAILPRARKGQRAKFLVLIPAHNEASGLPWTLKNLRGVRYPRELIEVVVVADRCEDDTAAVVRNCGARCLERSNGPSGKGAAIAWAVAELRKDRTQFDALLIIDADTIADPDAFEAFNDGLLTGHKIQQGYCYISNPWESPFTRLIAVTSILRNRLFFGGKAAARLSGMLAGTGMCFSREIVEKYGWTAFSVGEDIEFSVSLLLAGERIEFNRRAQVFQLESSSMQRASGQRLRWAGGRSAIAANSVWALLRAALRRRSLYLLDASVTLAAPNYSSQATVAVLTLCAAGWFMGIAGWRFLGVWAALLVGLLATYFLLGVALTGAPRRTLAGIALIPVFLPWRMAIEVLGVLGYGRGRWIHTARVSVSHQTVSKE